MRVALIFPVGVLEDMEPLIWHIGNLTLLEPKLNKNVGNKQYSAKVTEYAKSEIELTKQLSLKYSSWNENSVTDRARDFAKIVDQVWRIP